MNRVFIYFLAMAFFCFSYIGASAHPPLENGEKSYLETVYRTDPLPISEAIFDKETEFLFVKLAEPHEENGLCSSPSDFIVRYIAYPLYKLADLLDSKWHVLVVSYAVDFTAVQYDKKKTCAYDGKEVFKTVKTPDGNEALLVDTLLVLFPRAENQSQWIGVLAKAAREAKAKKAEEIKKRGGGQVFLWAR